MTSTNGIETRVVAVLDGLGTEYEVIEIDPDYADTADFCAKYGYEEDECGNTIVVASRREPRQFSASIVKGSSRLDANKTVRKLMGVRKLSFASAEDTMELTGMEIGGVTPFALPDDLPVYVDSLVMDLDSVILGSGSRSSKISVSPEVFTKMANAEIVEGLSLPPRE